MGNRNKNKFESAIIEAMSFQNNRESQLQLECYLYHFAKQGARVLKLLQEGKRLNTKTASRLKPPILDLRPRIREIKALKFDVEFDLVKNGKGLKDWYVPKNKIKSNYEKLLKL